MALKSILRNKKQYNTSWNHVIKEVNRLIERILKCPQHNTHETVSLNQVQQIIRKLSRPIAEIARLIEENKQLAQNSIVDENGKRTVQSVLVSQLDIDVIALGPSTYSMRRKHTY